MARFSYVSDSKKQTDLAEDRSVLKSTYSKGKNIMAAPIRNQQKYHSHRASDSKICKMLHRERMEKINFKTKPTFNFQIRIFWDMNSIYFIFSNKKIIIFEQFIRFYPGVDF